MLTPHLNLGPQIIPHQDNVTKATIILGNSATQWHSIGILQAMSVYELIYSWHQLSEILL